MIKLAMILGFLNIVYEYLLYIFIYCAGNLLLAKLEFPELYHIWFTVLIVLHFLIRKISFDFQKNVLNLSGNQTQSKDGTSQENQERNSEDD